MSEVVYHEKYQPLFQPYRGIRYILIKGGRGSGKSFALSSALLTKTYDDPFNILYTRYTLTSAEVSIIPEYLEKMDLLGRRSQFYTRKAEITNLTTGGTIFFRGLMASSGNQVARLKSIHNVKIWVLDEAQELDDESLFTSIDLSIRAKETENAIALCFNPTDINHWIYKRFYANLQDEDFCGVIGDTLYISTNYLENLENLSESFIAQAEAMKASDPAQYDNLFLGHFATFREGLIYTRWQPIADEEYPETLPQWYGNDWGYSDDPDGLVRMCYDPLTGTLYVKELCYKSGMLTRDVGAAILADAAAIGYKPEDCTVYVDPARPEGRDELRIHFGLNAVSAVNRDKAGRIAYLKGFRVRYVGKNIGKEVSKYSYKPQKNDRSYYTQEPQDGNDHLMDAINYGAVTHLRLLGISSQ